MDELLEIMDSYKESQDEPKVGIFWYSPLIHDLFGVVSINLSSQLKIDKRNRVSCDALHKYEWKKNYHKYKYHPNKKDLFKLYNGDYKYTPRGHIFYNRDTDDFDIMVGEWINEYPEAIDLIKYEFNLNSSDIKVNVRNGIHWEICMGYGD